MDGYSHMFLRRFVLVVLETLVQTDCSIRVSNANITV